MRRQVFVFAFGLACGIAFAGLLLQINGPEASGKNALDTAIDSNQRLAGQSGRPPADVNTTDQTEALASARIDSNSSNGEARSPASQSNDEIGATETKTTDIVPAKTRRDLAARREVLEATIPEPYASMVEPKPLPESLTIQEMFEEFNADQRDESWAYPMELGIEQLIARRGSELKAAFEFVECRSRFCTVAGVVYEGDQSTVNTLLGEMTQSGWWQTYGGASTVGSSQDTGYRFVTIFPRDSSDVERNESAPKSVAVASGT